MMQTVTPLPMIGDVVRGRDVVGRELRISGHPDSDRVVLSIWQDGRCQATVRLSRADIPGVTKALVAGLVPVPQPRGSETTSRPRRARGSQPPPPPPGARRRAARGAWGRPPPPPPPRAPPRAAPLYLRSL